MNTTLTRAAVVDAVVAQLAMRRLQNTAYQRLARRVLEGDQRQHRPHVLPVSLAARARTAA